MPLGELKPGEQLRSGRSSIQTSPFELQTSTVLSLIILNQPIAVYNIEVHCEHVYQVSQLGVLVHNAGDCLVRFGDVAETTAELASDAAKAVKNGFPHGVSTKLVKRLSGSDKLHRSASKEAVEALFTVEQTGKNLNHFTMHLPHPVTDEVAALFNSLFKLP